MDLDALSDLIDWLEQWEKAQGKYFAWVKKEYTLRASELELQRQIARTALYRALERHLQEDNQGRVHADTAKAAKGKQKFKDRVDEILAGLVEYGEEVFEIKGRLNRTGIYVGNVKPSLRDLALSKLKKAFDAAQN